MTKVENEHTDLASATNPALDTDDVDRLKGRLRKLAAEKSSLELTIRMMSNISEVSGLEHVIDRVLQSIMATIGGTKITLFCKREDGYFVADALGEKKTVASIEDADPASVADPASITAIKNALQCGELTVIERHYDDTDMTRPTREMRGFSWVHPLTVGSEVIGAIQIENSAASRQDFAGSMAAFLAFAAQVMKNELLNTDRLKEANDELSCSNAQLQTYQNDLEELVIKRTEELQQAESIYRALVENNAIIPWEIDLASMNFSYVGPQANGILGYPPECWTDFDFWVSILHPDDRAGAIDFFHTETDSGRDHESEYRCINAKGQTVWVRDFVTVEKKAGRPVALRGYLQDITARKTRELAVGNILKAVSSGIGQAFFDEMTLQLAKTLDCDIAFIGKLTGADSRKIRTQSLCQGGEIIDNFDYALDDSPCENVMDSGACIYPSSVCEIFPRDQLLVDMGIDGYAGVPLRNRHGESTGLMVILNKQSIRDTEFVISVLQMFAERTAAELERRQSEEERKELGIQLHQSQKMEAIGQLAGGVAHDFNNMLGGILGATELLQRFLPDDPESKQYYNMIIESAERAAGLTNKLLAFARKQPVASSAIDAHQVLTDMVAFLQSTIDRRIEIYLHLAAESCQVIGDPSQLQSAFLNLGINASHAMPRGGTIHIASSVVELDPHYCKASPFDIEPGSYLEIEVQDTGCGITPEDLPRIFEPFFTTKEQGKGTGLGLAAVFGTVQQHHGAITAYSELGSGTSFHVVLPLADQDVELQPDASPEVLSGTGKILVVDDEPVMRATASAILEDLGYEVQLAENGKQALAIFTEDRHQNSGDGAIQLVILDMIMPEMNGRDCFEAMRRIDPDAKVILSSGFTQEEDMELMKTAGLCGFIRKPYRITHLSQIVHDTFRAMTKR